jgi:hypothetical protein
MSCVNYSARKREARHVQRRQLEMHLGSIEFYIYVMHSSREEKFMAIALRGNSLYGHLTIQLGRAYQDAGS